MQQFDLKRLTLRDLWKIFRRRMWVIILPFVAVVTIAIPGSFLLTPEYQAEVILISQDVDEASVIEGLVSMRLSPQERIQMIVERIQSRKYMNQVAAKTNIAEYLRRKRRGPVLEQHVIKYLRGIVSVRRRAGDIIAISVVHEEPNRAMNIANAVATVYVDNTLLTRQEAVSGSLSFIDKQLAVFQERLSQAEQNLLDEQKKGVLESLDKDSATFLEQLTKLDADLVDNDLTLQQAQEQLRVARSRLQSGDSRSLQFTNPEILRLKAELASLNVQLTELQKKYSDDWPEVKRLKVEVAQKEAELGRAENKIPQNAPQDTNAESEYWQEEVRRLTIQKSALMNKIAEYNQKLQQMPQRQLNLARLTREKAAIENMYSLLLQRRNNAIILQATESDKKGHVAEILDAAVLPEKPIKPDKKKIAVMAVALGLMLGGGAAFLLEFFDHSFYTVEELEEYTKLDVLGTIPRVATYDGELKDQNNQRLKIAGAIAGGLLILLLIIDLINFGFISHNSQFLKIAQKTLNFMK